MRDFKKTRGRRAQYFRMGVGLAAMGVLALVAFGTADAAWGMYGKFADASTADAAAQAELANLQTQYAGVSTTVAELSTSRGQDAAVRERYGVGLPGEGEIDIVRKTPPAATSTPPSMGFWASIWQALAVW